MRIFRQTVVPQLFRTSDIADTTLWAVVSVQLRCEHCRRMHEASGVLAPEHGLRLSQFLKDEDSYANPAGPLV